MLKFLTILTSLIRLVDRILEHHQSKLLFSAGVDHERVAEAVAISEFRSKLAHVRGFNADRSKSAALERLRNLSAGDYKSNSDTASRTG